MAQKPRSAVGGCVIISSTTCTTIQDTLTNKIIPIATDQIMATSSSYLVLLKPKTSGTSAVINGPSLSADFGSQLSFYGGHRD